MPSDDARAPLAGQAAPHRTSDDIPGSRMLVAHTLYSATTNAQAVKTSTKPTQKPTQTPTASPTKTVYETSGGGHVPEESLRVFPFTNAITGNIFQSCAPFEPAKHFPFTGATYREPLAPFAKSSRCYIGLGPYSPKDASKRLLWGFCHKKATSMPTMRPITSAPTKKSIFSNNAPSNQITHSQRTAFEGTHVVADRGSFL